MDGLLGQAKARVARFCAYRERAPKEVLDKLEIWGLTQQQAQQILDELKQENFVNEERFARAFCHDKFEFNQWGKYKIEQALHPFGLERRYVELGLAAIDEERYRRMAKDLAKRKWERLKESDGMKKKKKVLDYLFRKGFEQDLVWDVIGTLE